MLIIEAQSPDSHEQKVYHQFLMEIRQLQGLIEECKAFQQKIDSILTRKQSQQRQALILRDTIKKTRLEIIDLQYQLKARTRNRSIATKNDKNLYQIQKQIADTAAINIKIKEQHQQLLTMGTNLRKKIDHTENKITSYLRQIQMAEKYEQQIKMGQALDQIYWQLRSELQSIIVQGRQEKDSFEKLQRFKQEELLAKQEEIEQIDQMYISIEEQVRIQREVINSIIDEQHGKKKYQSEVILKSEVKIMDQEQAQHFNKTEDLNVIEKAELQNIYQKQEFKKIQQAAKIGKILHQQNKTHFYGRIVRLHQRSKLNTTDISHLRHPNTEQSQISYSQHKDLDNSRRIEQLEKRKRIRTRETEMKRFLQLYKNRLSDEPSASSIEISQISDLKSKNILDVYENLKKQSAVKHRTVGNIEIIKLMKKHKKRKVGPGGKGISIECENESLL